MWAAEGVKGVMLVALTAVLTSGCASRTKFPEGRPAQLVTSPHNILVIDSYLGAKLFDDPLRAGLEKCGVIAEFMSRQNPAGGEFVGDELKNQVFRKAEVVGADHVLEVNQGGRLEQTGSIRRTYFSYSVVLTHLGSGQKVWTGSSLTTKTDQLVYDLLAAMARDGALPSCPRQEAQR